MSVISILVALLGLGFVGVGLVGFFGWRARMRNHDEQHPGGWFAERS